MNRVVSAAVLLLCLCLLCGSVACSSAKDTTAPGQVTGLVETTPCNSATASFEWEAASADSGVDHYLVAVDGGGVGGVWEVLGNVTTYTRDITAYSPGSHTFAVKAVDEAGNEGSEASVTFTIDSSTPVIGGVTVSGITDSSATVTWTTTETSTSQVEYGVTSTYGSSSVLESSLVTNHTVNLTGLVSGTTYHYRAKSRDACTNEGTSADGTFSTVQPTPAIAVLSHSSFLSSSGTFHVVGEVKNNSSKNRSYVKLTATFYNSDNTVVGTDFAYTEVDILLPNEKSPFEILEIDEAISAQIDHYSVVVSDSNVTTDEPYRSFAILSKDSYTDSTGTFHAIGELQNTGSQAADYVKVVVTLYDSAGKVVGTDFTYTEIDTVLAGQKSPFEVLELDNSVVSKMHDYELAIADANVTTTAPYRAFTILSQSHSVDITGSYHVVGEVRNTGTQSATYVKVVATFYDSAGDVVATDFGYTDPSTLAAGQTAPFEIIVLSQTQSAKISTYELQVQS
mgnify:CR=1 FL=1